MKKKLQRGQPLTELVKGSLDYTMSMIRQAFVNQFGNNDRDNFYLSEIFSDHVIVSEWGSTSLKTDEYYKVMYQKSGDSYSFDGRDQWEVVELAYQPQTREQMTSESKKKGKGKRFEERLDAVIRLEEAEEGKPRRIRIKKAMTADVVNGNGRRYPAQVLRAAVDELNNHLHESAGQGRAVQLLGEAEHPSDKPTRRSNLLETVIKWEEVTFDGQDVDITGRILETSKGKDIQALMEGGVEPGASMRGYGEGKTVKENGDQIFEVSDLHITGFDLVLEPSFENAAQLIESIVPETPDEEEAMSEELLTKLQEQEAEKAKLQQQLVEAQKAKDELEALKAEKAEAERKSGVANAIQEACKDLPFGEKLNKQFQEALIAAAPNSAEAVKALAEAKRKEYGEIAAAFNLKSMGFNKPNIQPLGDVIENETGTPEFARASVLLTESLARADMREPRDLRKPVTRSEFLAAKLLERFDKLYRPQLLNEARMFQEAELTTDLNLPYSVSRAIIAEAFPSLVAANIFDVDTIETSPTRLYFEAHTAETGYSATATAEVVTGGAEEVWYSLDYGRVTPGTVTVTSNPAGTTYTENTDYVINYADGKIKFLAAGDIGTNDVLVTYTYTAIRKGEMAPIERAKLSLTYITVEAAADRLADQISREAIVFSRSQLGYDVVSRTMASLIRQTQRKIDQGLLYMALTAVKSVANNSGGAWTTGNDESDYDDLVRLIGETKVKVANRYYMPSYILMSVTNAEDLSNWRGFRRDGFPNAILNAAGYAGNVKGLPVFASTEFPDTDIVVGNRELVMYRVFQPMIIKGPFPTYDVENSTAKLVAADQYYTEEFNVTESPVEEKGAYLTVTAGS